MTEEKDITVFGKWKVLRPDTRQYKQQSIEIELGIEVAVKVPAEYVVARVDPNAPHTLTLEGMKFVQNQFEKLYLDPTSETGEEVNRTVGDDWDDEKETRLNELITELSQTKDDGWGDADIPFPPSDKKEPVAEPMKEVSKDDEWGDDVFDEPTSTSSNVPDTEEWNEDEEDWKG